MNTLSRKQREIAGRHAMFMDIARQLLAEEGFHNLSMERIAELAEYSKGTVYQHFSCKEEILVQMCNTSMTQLLALFRRASGIRNTHRSRMLAVTHAHSLWAKLDNTGMSMLQHLNMHGVKEKVSAISVERHDELENRIFGSVYNIVQEAIDDGDLPQPTDLSATDIVFGLWSMCFGSQLLQTNHVDLQHFGITNPPVVTMRMASVAMDGLNWAPLHEQADFTTLQSYLSEELFAEEHRELYSHA